MRSKNIPKEEDYKIKYVFKEDSNVDVNEVMKKCFLMELNAKKIKKIAQ